MVKGFILVLLLLNSCASDYSDIKKFNREYIFHGNSSKIWIINRVKQKGTNYAAIKLKDKDAAIFFESGKILIQPLNSLGTFPAKTGTLKLSDDNMLCEFNFPDEIWRFKTQEISSKKISLIPEKSSDFFYELELISYPDKEN